MRRDSWRLGEICNIGQGMTTGLNEAFIVSESDAKKHHLETRVLKKYVKTRDIRRYLVRYRNLYLIYTAPELSEVTIPNTIKYLGSFRSKLVARYQFKAGTCQWFGIGLVRNRRLFDGIEEKLLVPNYSTSNKFAYDDQGFYTLTDTYVLVRHGNQVGLKYILGILNSRLMNYFYRKITKLKREGYMEYFTDQLSEIPVKKLDLTMARDRALHDAIVKDVDRMISLTKAIDGVKVDFNRHIDEPILDHIRFRTLYRNLSSDQREALDNTSKGNIRSVEAKEEGRWLRFSVNCLARKGDEKFEVRGHDIVRCRIEDQILRRFIMYYASRNWRSLGYGNLLHKILTCKLPVFSTNQAENRRIMSRVVNEYSKSVKLVQRLLADARQLSSSLDTKIYDLYGLNSSDRTMVESEIPENALLPEIEDEVSGIA